MRWFEMTLLFEGLSAFEQLRHDGQVLLKAYIDRLLNDAHLQSSVAQGGGNPQYDRSTVYKQESLWNRVLAGIWVLITFLKFLPCYRKQWRYIREHRESSKDRASVVVAIASSRLHSDRVNITVKQYVAALTSALPGDPNRSSISNEIASAETLWVCDAMLHSSLWSKKEDCWQDRVFIIDIGFILYVILRPVRWIILRSLIRSLNNRITALKEKQVVSRTSPTFKYKLIALLIISAYHEIIQRSRTMTAYFLTSNSFVTEILRVYLLQQQTCHVICEILHGVPTKDYERFLATIADLASESRPPNSSRKLQFVPQLPNLPLDEFFKNQLRYDNRTGINTYLNKFWLLRKTATSNLTTYIEQEIHTLFSGKTSMNGQRIIAFIGGTSHDRNYLDSNLFKIECFMLQHINALLSSQGTPFCIIYTPHPAHDINAFIQNKLFSDKQIILYQDTVFTWLIADMCVSLLSSALFEASYFGVPSFTPMIAEDKIYRAPLLDMLNYPKPCNDLLCLDALTRFILDPRCEPSGNLLGRAVSRAELMIPTTGKPSA